MDKMIKHIFFLLFLSFFYTGTTQQVALNTQFYYFDFILNPSLSGTQDYNPIYLSYRNQWTGFNGSPETIHVGGNYALNSYNALGIQFFQDNHGGSYKQSGITLNYARHFIIKDNISLSVGAGALVDQFSGDYSGLELSNSSDNIYLVGQESKMLADAVLGFNLSLNRFNVGLSATNLLQSKVSNNNFQGNDNNLKRQYNLLCGYILPIDSGFVLEPKILVRGLESGIFHGDILLLSRIKDLFMIGVSHRIGVAWSFIAGIEFKGAVMSYSYDLSTSGLQSYTGSTHEIVLGYKFNGKGGNLNNDRDLDGLKDKKDHCPDVAGPIENQGCPETELDGPIDTSHVHMDTLSEEDTDMMADEDQIKDLEYKELDLIEDHQDTIAEEDTDMMADEDQIKDLEHHELDLIEDHQDTIAEEDTDMITTPDEETTLDKHKEDADVQYITEGVKINTIFEDVGFGFDRSFIDNTFYPELLRIANLLKEHPKWRLKITGHADARRDVEKAKKLFKIKGIPYSKEAHDKMSKQYNYRLSQRRAQSVITYLVKQGISKTRLEISGKGEDEPIATNDTEEGRQRNRRVEVLIIK